EPDDLVSKAGRLECEPERGDSEAGQRESEVGQRDSQAGQRDSQAGQRVERGIARRAPSGPADSTRPDVLAKARDASSIVHDACPRKGDAPFHRPVSSNVATTPRAVPTTNLRSPGSPTRHVPKSS